MIDRLLGAIIIAGDSSIKLLAKVTGGIKSSYHPCLHVDMMNEL